MPELLTFSQALDILKKGASVARFAWPEGMVLRLFSPDGISEITFPFFYIETISGRRAPWQPDQNDLLCEEWYVISSPLPGKGL